MKTVCGFLIVCCLGLVFDTTQVLAAKFKIGGWTGHLLTKDDGDADGCEMIATYTSGIHLSIMMTTKSEWVLTLVSKNWNFREGATQKVVLSIDDKTLFHSEAISFAPTALLIRLNKSNAAIEAIRRGTSLEIRTKTGVQSFRLNDTYKGIELIKQCVRDAIASNYMKAKTRTTFSGLNAKTGPTTDNPQVVVVKRDKLLAFVINLLSAAGIRGFQILPADQAHPDEEIFWSKPDGGYGSFRAIRVAAESELPIKYGPPGAVEEDANACKGKFVTTKKGAQSAKGVAIDLVFTVCKDGDQSFARQYTFIGLINGLRLRIAQWQTGEEVRDDADEMDGELHQNADWTLLE